MSDLKTGLAEAVNINGIKFNEVRDVTILILISVTVMFLINDIVRFEIMIHCLYATFLIAMGMIILNTSRYKM